MTDEFVKVIVDCEKKTTKVIPLSKEEIAEREAMAVEAQARRLVEEQEQAELEAAKAAAKEKLAKLGLTAEEIAAITGA
jgi:hypothetical protein